MGKNFYLDLIERSGWSFAQGFVGSYAGEAFIEAVTSAGFALSVTERFSIALGTGLAAVAKCILAVKLPWTASNSASTLPAENDPPAVVK